MSPESDGLSRIAPYAAERRRTGEPLATVVSRIRKEDGLEPPAPKDRRVRVLDYVLEDLDAYPLDSCPAEVRRKVVAARRLLGEAASAMRQALGSGDAASRP